jgi:hypothetical protein
VRLRERIQTHRPGPYSAIRGEASVSRSRRRCFGGRGRKGARAESAINKRRQRIFV